MPYREPVTLICPDCGAEFQTRCVTRIRCSDCIKRHKADYQRVYAKAWIQARPEKKAEYNRRQREKTPPIRVMPEAAYPLKTVPCMGGCGKMLGTRNRNGRVMCPDCKAKAKAEARERFVAKNGCTPQQAWNKKNPEKSRESSRRYYEKNKDAIAEKRLQRLGRAVVKITAKPPVEFALPKPKPIQIVKPKTTTAKKAKTQPAKRLPTEAEKLAMWRAALKKYYGD